MKINKLFSIFITSLFLLSISFAQEPPPTPTPPVVGEVTIKATKANIDPGYVSLRKVSDSKNSFSGEYATVNNLVIKRDTATFTLHSGEIYFLEPVDGKTNGAVFIGNGDVSLTPPVDAEKKMLNFFINAPELKEQFTELVMFFTDETFEEVKKSQNATISTNGSQSGKARDTYRNKENSFKSDFRYNLTTRILMDKYSSPRAGFFYTFIEGKKYKRLLFKLDPLGLEEVYPEQVMLMNYSQTDYGIWTAFHLTEEYKKGTAKSSQDRRTYDLIHHQIEATLRGTKLIALDKVTIQSRIVGQRVIPLDLFPTLRVKRVTDEKGEEINIIQENHDKDGGLAIILQNAPEIGKPFILNFEYEGEEVVIAQGTGNFILNPSARASWYPNNAAHFGDRATFDITFRYPKKFTMIGVGELVEPETIDEDFKIGHWSSKDVEMKVAGFNYGDFIKKEVKDTVTGYNLEVYVNREMPNEIRDIQARIEDLERQGYKTATTLGAMSTTAMADTVLVEAQNSVRIYDGYFGKTPFKRFAMSQQPNTFFGQAWATLIYMPYMAFISDTQRTQLFGVRGGTNSFWREVSAHEVAHQWWGHSVSWSNYHDQWMSEGFAEFSTSLYIQFIKKDLKKFNEFWEDQRKQIVESSPSTGGYKPYTVGPITQGYRLRTAKTGRVVQNLIYPKGAYVVHMIRMMMYDQKDGDLKFQIMMRDFIKSHFNQDVSTEDFKAIVEKHITPKMDIDQNGKMDWFFDKWVYGTEIPSYKFEYKITNSNGKGILSGTITQADVSDDFAMVVPIYLDFGNNNWTYLGNVTIAGNDTVDLGEIQLPKVPQKAAICALNDVLATNITNKKK